MSLIWVVTIAETDTDQVKDALQFQLKRNRDQIMKCYAHYVTYIHEALIKKEVDVAVLKQYLLNLPALKYRDDEEQHKLLFGKREKLQEATSVNNVISIINGECSFLNYDIFKSITEKYEIIDDSSEDLKYPEKLKDYLKKHTILELAKVFPSLESRLDSSKKKVIFKFDIKATKKASDISNLKNCIAEILDLDFMTVQIIDISEGCVVVTFSLPAHIADIIFPCHPELKFTPEQTRKFQALNVIWLKYDDRNIDFRITGEVS